MPFVTLLVTPGGDTVTSQDNENPVIRSAVYGATDACRTAGNGGGNHIVLRNDAASQLYKLMLLMGETSTSQENDSADRRAVRQAVPAIVRLCPAMSRILAYGALERSYSEVLQEHSKNAHSKQESNRRINDALRALPSGNNTTPQ